MAKGRHKATGNCYQRAGEYFMDLAMFGRKPDMRLCHGEVSGRGSLEGVRFGHAWVEDGEKVYDGGTGDIYPKKLYYSIGKIGDNVHKYNFSEFKAKVTETGHWGPWDLVTESGL